MATIILRIRLHRLEDKELVVVYEEEMGGKTRKYIVHVIIGNAVLCGIYFLDYTWIARHAKKIGVAGIVCMCFIYDFKHVRQYLRLLIEWIKFRIHPCHSAGRCFYHLFPLLFRKMKKEQ